MEDEEEEREEPASLAEIYYAVLETIADEDLDELDSSFDDAL